MMNVDVERNADQKNGSKRSGLKFLIAGGGTGGHIFPAIAIANALKTETESPEILFVGAKGKMEMEKVPQAGYDIKGIDIAGFNRSSLIKNFGLPWKLVKSFLQVRHIVNEFKPDAVIGVGGYSSFPVLRFAQYKGIPTFIHEANSFAGKSNIWLGKKATKIYVASDGLEKFFPADKILITGNPVRPDIVNVLSVSKSDALKSFGLTENLKTVLVIGGSLGARSINEAIANGLDKLISAGLQVIWQTGKSDAAKWKEKTQGKSGIWVGEFITNMQQAYAAADVVVSRAGAMAIAELCVVQKPVLFVPYPFAAEDHQTANALHLVQKKAALMVIDNEAGERVVPQLLALVNESEKQVQLSQNIGLYKITDADKRVAEDILKNI